jgi:hypothetical protein
MQMLPPAGAGRTRMVVLLGLFVAAIGMLVWTTLPSGPAVPAPAASNPASPSAPPAAGAMPLPEPIDLHGREQVPSEPVVGRNPFRFGNRPAPPLAPLPPPVEMPPVAAPPPAPVGPPPIALRLLGVVQLPGGQTVATLRDPATGGVFQALEGQTVDGRYRVVKIGVQSVVVSYVDGSGQRALAIGG